jgi:hypothetical protein
MRFLLFLVLIIGLTACSEFTPPVKKESQTVKNVPPSEVTPILSDKQRIEALEKTVKELIIQMRGAEATIRNINSGTVVLPTQGEGYAPAYCNLGNIIVLNRGITPSLDGYTVNIGVVNMSSVILSGAEIDVLWGAQSKTVNVTEDFRPAKQTNLSLFLSPATAEDMKLIFLTFKFNQVLYGR